MQAGSNDPPAFLPLFRREVAEARANRLHGEILIPQQLSQWALLSVLGGAGLLLLGLAIFMPLPHVELASGTITPQQPIVEVLPERPGTIEKVAVEEGDEVWPGEMLVRISTRPSANTEADPRHTIEGQVAIAHSLVGLEAGEHEAEVRRLSSLLAGLTERRRSLAGQIDVQKRLVRSSRKLLDAVRPVLERGFVSQLEFERRQQDVWRAEQQLSSLAAEIAGVDASLSQGRAELAALPGRSDRRRLEAEQRTLGLAREMRDYALAGGYELRARTHGRVSGLNAIVGQQTDGRTPLMAIVPVEGPMIAEVTVPSRTIGFLRPGQKLQIRYEAFPYQRYGSFSATVAAIPAAPIEPEPLRDANREPAYRVRLKPAAQAIATARGLMTLRPGMRLSAAIVLERSPLLPVLFRPGSSTR